MSYFQQIHQVGPNHFVLPRIKDMKCRVDVFLSPDLLAQTIANGNEDLWQQAVNSASYEGVTGVYLMPDTHTGFGIPIGGVVVTDETIIQSGSGYDISCGVLALRVPGLLAENVVSWDKREKWVVEVEQRVALGIGSERPPLALQIKPGAIDNVLRYGAKAVDVLNVKTDVCERLYIPVPADTEFTKIERAYSKAAPQLGSLGGGNHFIEMQVDQEDGSVWIMIHSGSRGYGWQTANHFYYEAAKLRGLAKNQRERSHLFADEPLGREYWAHHNSAANFAIANRFAIAVGVMEALGEVFGVDAVPYYDISHNLIQEETLVLPDGNTRKGFVHRKGATRAFPSGHPDLEGTRWEKTGHPCLIPGSMFSGAAILFPRENAHQSACSVNHGSGRLYGRAQAKRELEEMQDDIDEEMQTVKREFAGVEIEGIVSNTEKTPLDECTHVYKDLDTVVGILVDEGITKVARRMWPVANIKGVD